jgi:hypothetical protein
MFERSMPFAASRWAGRSRSEFTMERPVIRTGRNADPERLLSDPSVGTSQLLSAVNSRPLTPEMAAALEDGEPCFGMWWTWETEWSDPEQPTTKTQGALLHPLPALKETGQLHRSGFAAKPVGRFPSFAGSSGRRLVNLSSWQAASADPRARRRSMVLR